MNLKREIDQIAKDKGIDSTEITGALEEAMRQAARKRFGQDKEIEARYNDEIGEVEEVLVDENGQAVAVVVESGGFLGIGDRESIVMLDQLGLQGDQLVTTLSKEELESAPEWND